MVYKFISRVWRWRDAFRTFGESRIRILDTFPLKEMRVGVAI
jgi:hypothetical protein